MKASLVLPTLLALFGTRTLAATPPGCLLSAVNTQDNPTDLSSICGDEATEVQSAINSLCSGSTNKSAAQSAFIATCSAAGSSVAPFTATATATATTTNGPSSSGSFVYTTVISGSTVVTSGASAPTDSSATTTGSSASSTNAEGASATGNAASDPRQVGSFAAAVIAIAGVVAVL
ncbi:hypothetical protein PV08_08924 [Exophiala spinifera]|uniref:Extracellular membrane protein CFEM domain-containing protein n=1 Tax=Exophiala spinifera TaxID=91928 RepID=A0A0D2B448_9EURO|nr:uncharacterized protein PV08_08924 [Exophiala spinifera]KIW13733.1 hypothetical protein PV08_08924 [Exophiala spinifera]